MTASDELEGIWKEKTSYNVFNLNRRFVICKHKSSQFKNIFLWLSPSLIYGAQKLRLLLVGLDEMHAH
jgi:hypothetical protein